MIDALAILANGFAIVAGCVLAVVVSYAMVDTAMRRRRWASGPWWTAMVAMGLVAIGNVALLARVLAPLW